MHTVAWPFCLAFARAGNNSAARMAMIAITTSNSIRVKATHSRDRCPDRLLCHVCFPYILFITSLRDHSHDTLLPAEGPHENEPQQLCSVRASDLCIVLLSQAEEGIANPYEDRSRVARDARHGLPGCPGEGGRALQRIARVGRRPGDHDILAREGDRESWRSKEVASLQHAFAGEAGLIDGFDFCRAQAAIP